MEAAANTDVQPPCYDQRGPDVDTIFATGFTSDRCLDALTRAQAKFHRSFPGWALWRRLLTGDALLDRTLEAYAVTMARGVSRALKGNGRRVVARSARRNEWIAQAGRDALDFALFGKFAAGSGERSERFGVDDEAYKRVRDVTAWGLTLGAESFRAEAVFQYWKYYAPNTGEFR